MVNRAAIAGVIILATGVGAAVYFLSGPGERGMDARGRALLKDVEAERKKDPVERESCRKLLLEFRSHPRHATDRDLVRGRAWLEFLIDRSVPAWEIIEANLGVEATPEDALIGSKILERRFAETGNRDLAHRGATLARTHFEATGAKGSLFLAWQLQVRRENVDRRAEFARLLVERFPDSVEARLVKVLINYPGLREEAPGALEELRKLENEFPTIPTELDLALAWFEVQDPATHRACLDRVERVMRTFQSSITARSLGSIAAYWLGDWKKSKAWLEALLRQYPNHADKKLWAAQAAEATSRLEKKG